MSPLVTHLITKVFPAILLGFGIYLFGAGTRTAVRATVASHWPSVSGTVIKSEVVFEDDQKIGRTGSFTPRVEYAYVVGSQRYTSTAVAAVQLGTSRRAPAEEFISNYPVGAQVVVRHHPRKPHIALLETGFSSNLLITPAMGFFLMLFGGGFLAAFMRGTK